MSRTAMESNGIPNTVFNAQHHHYPIFSTTRNCRAPAWDRTIEVLQNSKKFQLHCIDLAVAFVVSKHSALLPWLLTGWNVLPKQVVLQPIVKFIPVFRLRHRAARNIMNSCTHHVMFTIDVTWTEKVVNLPNNEKNEQKFTRAPLYIMGSHFVTDFSKILRGHIFFDRHDCPPCCPVDLTAHCERSSYRLQGGPRMRPMPNTSRSDLPLPAHFHEWSQAPSCPCCMSSLWF